MDSMPLAPALTLHWTWTEMVADGDWVGSDRHDGERSADVDQLIEGRARVHVLGQWDNSSGDDCGYDESALVELDGDYFALTTSGCSCPSPQETWCIDFGPATLAELREWCSKGPHAEERLPALLDPAEGRRLRISGTELERRVQRFVSAAVIDGGLPVAMTKGPRGDVLLTVEGDATIAAVWPALQAFAAMHAGLALPSLPPLPVPVP